MITRGCIRTFQNVPALTSQRQISFYDVATAAKQIRQQLVTLQIAMSTCKAAAVKTLNLTVMSKSTLEFQVDCSAGEHVVVKYI